jgi:hypothetical protein
LVLWHLHAQKKINYIHTYFKSPLKKKVKKNQWAEFKIFPSWECPTAFKFLFIMSLTNPNVKINVKKDRENGAKKSAEFIGKRADFFFLQNFKILLKLKNSAVLKINSAAVFVSRMFSK